MTVFKLSALIRSPVLATVMLLILAPAHASREYVVVTGGVVNIRSGPSTRSEAIVQVRKGDILEVRGEASGWYEIHLFSSGARYVSKSVVRSVDYEPEVPEDTELRREIYHAWLEVEARVNEEADERYSPKTQFDRHFDYKQRLTDRYKLELLRRFEVQPPIYRRIVIEGIQKGW